MLRQMRSKSDAANEQLKRQVRAKDEDNLAWGERAVAAMGTGGPDNWTYVVLLGGSDTMSFRLRVAQSHLRSDMLPSFWSEALLAELRGNDIAGARAWHVPLLQPAEGPFATRTNGVVERPLADFADTARWPNIAVIALPWAQKDIVERAADFRKARGTIDTLEHILRWLAFAWGSARTPNPLNDGIGLPSACMLETVCAAGGFDLTPGLESRASCPEAIWVAAKHWHKYMQSNYKASPTGRFFTPHVYPIEDHGSISKPLGRGMPR